MQIIYIIRIKTQQIAQIIRFSYKIIKQRVVLTETQNIETVVENRFIPC